MTSNMRVFLGFLLLWQVLSQAVITDVLTLKNLTFLIEHSFDQGESFHPRTSVQILPKSDGKFGLFFTNKNLIVEEDVEGLKTLIRSQDLYMIRVTSTTNSEDSSSDSNNNDLGNSGGAIASIPVCKLQQSGFKEDIQVFLSKNTGAINGLSYSSPTMTIPQPCDENRIKETVAVHTRIKLGEESVIPALPLQIQGSRPIYLKEVRLSSDEERQQQAQTQQPFLYKYWYVVVGLMIYLLLGGVSEPPQQGAPQGQGQAPPPQAK